MAAENDTRSSQDDDFNSWFLGLLSPRVAPCCQSGECDTPHDLSCDRCRLKGGP